jgi:WD40 repeat protein
MKARSIRSNLTLLEIAWPLDPLTATSVSLITVPALAPLAVLPHPRPPLSHSTVLWNTFGECENYNVLAGHKNAVLEVHWDASGSTLFSCSADKTVGLWDAKRGTRIRKLSSHTAIVNSCAVALEVPCLFASGSDDHSAMVWDSREKLPVQVIAHDYQVTSVCLDREGVQLYTGGLDNIIRRWDLRMPSALPSLVLSGHGNTITGLSLSPEGTHLLSNAMDSNLFGELLALLSSSSSSPVCRHSVGRAALCGE